MLVIEGLHVSYGPIAALRGIDVRVDEGKVSVILGPNGAGKSTLLSTICGLLKPRSGSISFEGTSIVGRQPEQIAELGISLVPEARHILGSLTVKDNMRLGATMRSDKAGIASDIDRMLAMFPPLQRYYTAQASGLSGGEQQMLAIARALMSRPRLLLLDEPSLGLAPVVIDKVFESLSALHDEGVTMLLVEQNAVRALAIADYAYVLRTGVLQLQGTPDELRIDSQFESIYLGGI